ncbi:MAG: preprotein translocase subunit YajC [Nitrosomonas sp.]|nr:preprotein translocase subunit YajC [Nitrosomonas sp.]MDP1950425.1 preprotein translocase subunit YajC [Nitrosomonas sp.]
MLISEAFAQAAAPAQSEGSFMTLLPLIGIFVIFYFLLIRPQSKRAKEQKLMIAALQRGDEIITSGGELGKITNVSESYVIVEIAPGVEVTVVKTAVQTLLPKGTLRDIAPAKSGKQQKATKSPKASEAPESKTEKDSDDASENNESEAPKNKEKD